ncbi:MAG: response regulator transcription factor [Acidobacteriota bacterium]
MIERPRVLVIEDDPDVASNIAEYLESRHFVLDFAYDGISGLHLAVTGSFDALVLDLMLPGIDGLTLCRRLRSDSTFEAPPILMLTARDALDDKIKGFEAGADDYLVKPFALPELFHRLQALLRRGVAGEPQILKVHDLELDWPSRTVRRAGQVLQLNRTELKILSILMRASPALVRRQDLADALWQDQEVSEDLLRSHIYRLRRAIDRPFADPLLHTVRGQGYLLRPPER